MTDHARAERSVSILQAGVYALVCMAALIVPMTAYAPRPAGALGTLLLLLYIVCGGAIGGVLMLGLQRVLAGAVSGLLLSATGGAGGVATKSYFGMSQVEALVMRGQLDQAAAQLRTAMYAHTGETGAEITQALADLLSFRMQAFGESASAYQRARRLWLSVGGTRGTEGARHCARRLIDLYEGPLANPAAASAERARLGAG